MSLVLTRKPRETIVLHNPDTGLEIHVLIAKVENNHVSLAITAPDHIQIDRYEIWMKKNESRTEEESNKGKCDENY